MTDLRDAALTAIGKHGKDLHGSMEAWEKLEDALVDLLVEARADGIEEGRGDMEHLERKWRAEARRECTEELRRMLRLTSTPPEQVLEWLAELATSWSGSGLTPADEGVMMSAMTFSSTPAPSWWTRRSRSE